MDYIMSLVLQSTGGGQITIQEPATASNFTQTLPAATGTVMVSGNQPAFSAYSSSNQTVGSAGNIKVTCNVEEFDTASCYDNVTNYRFTPNVAGYYQFSAGARAVFNSTSAEVALFLYKNGSSYKILQDIVHSGYARGAAGTCLVYANGTTDYFELYSFLSAAGTIEASATGTYFQAVLVRAG
jgi:hypothetical protein